MATAVDEQTLPPKEQGQFKQVIKMYENKQYSAALKSCNGILKKHPNHGETLSMKGLTLGSLDRKTEAYEFVKLGLMKSKCKSYVCWHVYGLLNRSDKNYDQAIKCYRNALNIDPDNLQILRDLAILQVHRMDAAGLVGTRHKILELKPNQRPNWLGFALAYHLNGDYAQALKVLDTLDQNMDQSDSKYENSELVHYRNMILFESGDYKKCLEHIANKDKSMLDKTALFETKAKCYAAMGSIEDAKRMYVELLKTNGEHRNYMLEYCKCAGHKLTDWAHVIDAETREATLKTLNELEALFPKSKALERVCLDIADGPDFRERLSVFVKAYLRKNIPSLYSALKSLYNYPEKVEIMTELFKEWELALKTNNKFPGEDQEEAPGTTLWLLMLSSAHCYRKGDYATALQYINAALEHTPTVEMLYLLKGRILKHQGELEGAWESVEKARLLDTADRYLNNKAAKYQLRKNDIKGAEKTMALFVWQPEDAPPTNNVVDMECMWYEIEEGDALHRQGDLLTAMQRYLLINKHFQDMEEDQFDFHTYCLRKQTMRAYIDLLRFEKRAHGHDFYIKAAKRVVKGYMEVFDANQAGTDLQSKVLAKEEPKQEKANGVKKPKKDDDEAEEEVKKDVDIKVNVEDPLTAAVPFAKDLVQYRPKDIASWTMSAELYLKKGKTLLALKHLLGGKKVDAKDTKLQQLVKELYAKADTMELSPHVKAVLDKHRAEF